MPRPPQCDGLSFPVFWMEDAVDIEVSCTFERGDGLVVTETRRGSLRWVSFDNVRRLIAVEMRYRVGDRQFVSVPLL